MNRSHFFTIVGYFFLILVGVFLFKGEPLFLKIWIIALSISFLLFEIILPQLKKYLLKKYKIKIPLYLEIIAGLLILIFIAIPFSSYVTIKSDTTLTKLDNLEKILNDYSETHTYSLVDFFVCADTSIDVWNLVKTKGINAQICVGNIEDNYTYEMYNEYLEGMNHAWVMTEAEPFKWVALETTGGYLEYDNEMYYKGTCFDNPKEFKEFVSLRDDYFEVCDKYNLMLDDWRENYVGTPETNNAFKYQGQIEQKGKECQSIINQLDGILV